MTRAHDTNRLRRRYLIEVTKSGELRIRDSKEKLIRKRGPMTEQDIALPIYSVDSREEGERLQVRLCVLERHDNQTYRLNARYRNDGDLELDDLTGLADLLERTHREQTAQYAHR